MTFKYSTDEDGDFIVIDKHILPSGMTVEIQFGLYDLSNVSVANVFLNVYKKGNKYQKIPYIKLEKMD